MAYTFFTSKNIVEEGSSVTITLLNPSLPNGTIVPFQIYGTNITLDDFVGLNSFFGEFIIQGGIGTLTLNISDDLKSEGTETVFIVLTSSNLGGGTLTSFFIADTSKTPTDAVIPSFIVTADKTIVEEGDNVTFTINVINLTSGIGTIVPYSIVGIQPEDIVNTPLFGNIVFDKVSGSNLVATLELQITEDFTEEGIETIVLLLAPDFAFTLEVTTSVQILDTSLDILPRITLLRSPPTIFETGPRDWQLPSSGQVRILLETRNIPAGFSPTFKIAPLANSEITFSDFFSIAGLTNFSGFSDIKEFEGTFPSTELDENGIGRSAIFIDVREDFILEGPEFFVVFLPDYNVSSSPIQIVDTTSLDNEGQGEEGYCLVSSIPLNNTLDQSIILNVRDPEKIYPRGHRIGVPLAYVGNQKFEEIVNCEVNISAVGNYESKWYGDSGRLSAISYIQGKKLYASEESPVYYQPFSYVIRTAQTLDKWVSDTKQLMHPAGTVYFGEINIDTEHNKIPFLGASGEGDAEITSSFSITADNSRILVSENTYSELNVVIPLKTDFSFRTLQIL